MERVIATRSKSKIETNNCEKMQKEKKASNLQVLSSIQIMGVFSWLWVNPGFDSQVYFIKTCDLSLAKEVFTYKLFGKRTEELSPAYTALNQSLM